MSGGGLGVLGLGPRARWGWAAFLFALFIAATWALYAPLGATNFCDDAYITFRYAHNLADGFGMVFQPGDAADSASSPLWTLLLALGFKAGQDAEVFAWRLSLVAGGLAWAWVGFWGGAKSASHLERIAFALPLALAGMLGFWAAQGMETCLFALALVLGVWRLAKGRVGFWGALALGLVPLVRYEGVLLLLAAALVGPRRLFKRAWLGWATTLILPFAWVLWCRFHFGAWIPQSFLVKRLIWYYSPTLRSRWLRLKPNWEPLALFFAVLPALLALWAWRVRRLSGVSALLFWTLVLAVVAVCCGPVSDCGRYGAPFLPLAALAVQRGALLFRRVQRRFPYRVLLWAFGAALTLTAATANSLERDTAVFWRAQQSARRVVGLYLAKHAQGQVVLSSDLGMLSWLAPESRFMDATGLVDQSVYSAVACGANLEASFKKAHPLWVADTFLESVFWQSSAQRILERPEDFFRVSAGLGFKITGDGRKLGKPRVVCFSGLCCAVQPILWPR